MESTFGIYCFDWQDMVQAEIVLRLSQSAGPFPAQVRARPPAGSPQSYPTKLIFLLADVLGISILAEEYGAHCGGGKGEECAYPECQVISAREC